MSKLDQAKTWEGRVVDGKFPLRQYLGGSDHSAVFLTEAADNAAQKIAIKLIDVDAGDLDNQLSGLRAAAGLTHPHLIRIFDVGRGAIEGVSFVYTTMELAEEDLSQILPQRALTPEEVRDMLPPVLEALAFLHGRGFVHGSVQPSNVCAVGEQLKLSADQITALGKPLPLPRGIADEGPFDSRSGQVRATFETAFPASDIWSLGATLVAALTRKKASSADAPVPENVPEPFRGIARDCLQVDPKRRPSIEQIYSRLQQPVVSAPATPAAVAKSPEAPQQSSASAGSRGRYAIVAVLVLAAIIVLGYFVFRGKGSATLSETAPPPVTPAPATTTPPRDAAGQVVRRVEPDIPANAQRTISGTIKIRARVEVDSTGKVTAAKLVSAGPSHYFAERALNAVRQWEFSAPVVNGKPTPSVWLIQFRLRRNSIQDSAQRLNR